ncbi:MAG: tetratricopeptide repeat protein [Candidatus Alcyoniella australis]|nr:tetratricopeptide repeat protein [Candidatus Alcyoniella australis]
MKRVRLTLLILALLAVAPYVSSLGHGQVGIEQPLYSEDYRYLSVSELGQVWLGDYAAEADDVYSHGRYQPLSGSSVLLDNLLFGQRTWGRHLVNLLLHLATVFGLYSLLRLRFPRSELAFWAAALFGVHPLLAHSVAWAPGRPALLAGALTIWALHCALRFINAPRRPRSTGWLIAAAGLAALAALAHSAALAAPLLLLALVAHSGMGNRQRLYSAAAILLLSQVPYWVLRSATGVWPADLADPGLTARLAAWPAGMVVIAAKALVPVWLCSYAGLAWHANPFADYRLWLSLALLVVLAIGLRRAGKKVPGLALGALWFAAAMLPVSNLSVVYAWPGRGWPIDYPALYLATGGATIVLAALISWLPRRAGATIGCLLLAAFCAQAFHQSRIWADAPSAYQCCGDDAVALNELGLEQMRRGQHREAAAQFQRAIEAAGQGESATPVLCDALLNLSSAQLARGQFENSERAAQRAIEDCPQLAKLDFVQALLALKVRNSAGGALEHLDRCLELRPNLPQALSLRSRVRISQGDEQGAQDDLQRALELWPVHPALSRQLAALYARKGEHQRAWELCSEALARDPDDADLLNQAAVSLIELEQSDRARELLQGALEREPQSVKLLIGLAGLENKSGDRAAALGWLSKARTIDPDNVMVKALIEQLEGEVQQPSPLNNFPAFGGQ